MVLSIKAKRDEVGLAAGELLIGGGWRPAADGRTWTHHHPATAEQVGTFAVATAADVDAAGGSAILWRAELLSARDEKHLAGQLQQARAEEYRALLDQVEQVHIDPDADPGRVVDRLRRELRRIRRRDYFPPPEQELARQAVEGLAGRTGQPTRTGGAPA